MLRCYQSLGDCSPQPTHRNNLHFPANWLRGPFRGDGRSLSPAHGRAFGWLGFPQHIFFKHTATGAGRLDFLNSKSALSQGAFRRRHHAPLGWLRLRLCFRFCFTGLCALCLWDAGLRLLLSLLIFLFLLLALNLWLLTSRGCFLPILLQIANDLPDFRCFTLLFQNLRNSSGIGRW